MPDIMSIFQLKMGLHSKLEKLSKMSINCDLIQNKNIFIASYHVVGGMYLKALFGQSSSERSWTPLTQS